jgi:hypothetical protein
MLARGAALTFLEMDGLFNTKCGSMLEMKTLFLVALRAADLLQIFLLLL